MAVYWAFMLIRRIAVSVSQYRLIGYADMLYRLIGHIWPMSIYY